MNFKNLKILIIFICLTCIFFISIFPANATESILSDFSTGSCFSSKTVGGTANDQSYSSCSPSGQSWTYYSSLETMAYTLYNPSGTGSSSTPFYMGYGISINNGGNSFNNLKVDVYATAYMTVQLCQTLDGLYQYYCNAPTTNWYPAPTNLIGFTNQITESQASYVQTPYYQESASATIDYFTFTIQSTQPTSSITPTFVNYQSVNSNYPTYLELGSINLNVNSFTTLNMFFSQLLYLQNSMANQYSQGWWYQQDAYTQIYYHLYQLQYMTVFYIAGTYATCRTLLSTSLTAGTYYGFTNPNSGPPNAN